MRKWILRIHLYGGLLCAPYLLIFGFSSLHFNHRFGFVDVPPTAVRWETGLQFRPGTNNEAGANAVRDSLGLLGWTLPWKTSRDDVGNLQFDLERPGKSYTIRTSIREGQAHVEERRKGFWQVVNSLHALENVPNSRFAPLWGIYTEICTGFVLFASLSGVYLWVTSRRERWLGIASLVTAVIVSLGLMIFVILSG